MNTLFLRYLLLVRKCWKCTFEKMHGRRRADLHINNSKVFASPERHLKACYGKHIPKAPEVQHKTLRVVQVINPSEHGSSVERIIISGRMSDVCAELERLAAFEAKFT